MRFEQLSPAEQIATLMRRIYQAGMTTTSGGNISLRDDRGAIWISPSGTDKGTLQASDVVCVHADGQAEGKHKPSVEYPFHQAVYDSRPDLRALVHAHPADLVAFSIVKTVPETHIVPQAQQICGKVGFAAYAIPGSSQLGANIAGRFAEGFDSVLLENHGAVCGGTSLADAFQRFETLDFCARLHIQARRLGKPRTLGDAQLAAYRQSTRPLPELPSSPTAHTAIRELICAMVHRCYAQHLMTSTNGTLSVRVSDGAYLITPHGRDRAQLEPDDLVLISDGHREAGKSPSDAALLHQAIYRQHPEIGAIITAQPPHAMAFAVTDAEFDIRTIPESYFVLRDVPKLPFGASDDPALIARTLARNSPVLMIENDALLATGATVLQAFDRLEVAEFTARSILHANALGGAVPMNDEQMAEIRKAFF